MDMIKTDCIIHDNFKIKYFKKRQMSALSHFCDATLE